MLKFWSNEYLRYTHWCQFGMECEEFQFAIYLDSIHSDFLNFLIFQLAREATIHWLKKLVFLRKQEEVCSFSISSRDDWLRWQKFIHHLMTDDEILKKLRRSKYSLKLLIPMILIINIISRQGFHASIFMFVVIFNFHSRTAIEKKSFQEISGLNSFQIPNITPFFIRCWIPSSPTLDIHATHKWRKLLFAHLFSVRICEHSDDSRLDLVELCGNFWINDVMKLCSLIHDHRLRWTAPKKTWKNYIFSLRISLSAREQRACLKKWKITESKEN